MQNECQPEIGTGSYFKLTVQMFKPKKGKKKREKSILMCIFMMRRFLFQVDGLNFGVLGSYFGSSEGVGLGLGPNRPKWSKNTTKHTFWHILWVRTTLGFLFGVVRRLFQGNTLYVCTI